MLHLATTLDRGGAENALLHLAAEQVRAGHEVTAACLKGAAELEPAFADAGVRIQHVGRDGFGVAGAVARARRLVASLRPEVLHTHLFKADTLGAALAGPRRRGARVLVSTKHNEDVYLREAAWRALGRRVAARADALVAISPGVARFVRETLGDAAARLDVIPYGLPPLARAGDGAAFRRAHGIAADAPLALCVARLAEQKDHATLLAAWRALPSPPHLVLLGRGPLETELRRRVQGLPVTFAGFVDDPADAYAAADVVVLASRHEGLGLVLLEAAQHGVPAVATRVGGIPDVVEDGATGLLVPAGDATALAGAVACVFADAALRTRLGGAARERVAARHALGPYAAAHERLYRELLGARA